MTTIPLGGLITLAVLLPNLLALLLPPPGRAPDPASRENRRLRTLEIFERVGQLGAFVTPFFYRISVTGLPQWLAIGVMAALLAIYYAGWVRYVRKGRGEVLLYSPVLGIPLAMALMPVLYFLAASILIHSLPLAVAAALLGLGHIPVSRASLLRLRGTRS